MHFSTLLAIFALGAFSAALPAENLEQREPSPALVPRQSSTACLSPAQGTTVANNFKTLINKYSNAAADKYLTSG